MGAIDVPRTLGGRGRRSCLVACGMLASWMLCAAPSPAADRDTGLARLTGVWQLDHRVSEDPERMLRQGGGFAPRRRGQEAPQPHFGTRVKLVTQGSNVLTFTYRDRVVTVTNLHDVVRTLRVDGKKHAVTRGDLALEVEAGWKSSDRLVVKTTGAPGGWIRETFELGERGDKLFVTVELQRKGSKWPFVFERLYHRRAGSE